MLSEAQGCLTAICGTNSCVSTYKLLMKTTTNNVDNDSDEKKYKPQLSSNLIQLDM